MSYSRTPLAKRTYQKPCKKQTYKWMCVNSPYRVTKQWLSTVDNLNSKQAAYDIKSEDAERACVQFV